MSTLEFKSWQAVQDEVLRRIQNRQWKHGELIPNEAELAVEFGCARSTVNRALRNLAETGLLDRKRRAGTRVALHPIRKATLEIPIIRREIESKGLAYRYSLLSQESVVPPSDIQAKMQIKKKQKLMHFRTLHMADGVAYAFENRWINPDVIPEIKNVDFSEQSPNEWLVLNIPFEGGDISFSAMAAGPEEAEILSCEPSEALFVIDRSTWTNTLVITAVRLTFAPNYRMHTVL